MELDHVFFLTTPSAPELQKLAAIGLTPTYRREHVGQGTANVCYCFENAFLEVLWITSEVDARSDAVARMQLAQRAAWRTMPASPFGIAWRGAPEGAAAPPTWPCRPPYLPDGMAIDVATDSDDVQQPLLFSFPGSRAPREWPESRRGTLQASGGFTRLELHSILLPADVRPSATLQQLAASCRASMQVNSQPGHELIVALTRPGQPTVHLRLPTADVTD